MSNERVKEAIKKNILERLWLLAMSMRDKKSVSQCGTILNKSATGAEYKWGLRFYILLIECFRQWAAFTADDEINSKYNDLHSKVPVLEDDVYYFQALENQLLNHTKADELAMDYIDGSRSPNPVERDRPAMQSIRSMPPAAAQSEPTEFVELRNYKQNFLGIVFSKTPDPVRLQEEHMMFASFYDSLRYKLNAGKPTPAQKAEIGFAEAVSRIQVGPEVETPKGLAGYRSKVGEAMQSAYGEIPREYEAFLGGASKKSAVQSYAAPSRGGQDYYDGDLLLKERYAAADVDPIAPEPLKPKPVDSLGGSLIQNPNSQPPAPKISTDVSPVLPQPIFNSGVPQNDNRSAPPQPQSRDKGPSADQIQYGREFSLGAPKNGGQPGPAPVPTPTDMYQAGKADFSKKGTLDKPDPERNREANRRLKEKKQALLQEIERLKMQERKMRESVQQRSTLSTVQKIEHTPEVLIEEIERKNRTYENLQNKYLALLGQMKSKVHSNLEKSYMSGSMLSRPDPETSSLSSSLAGNSLYNSRLYMPNERLYGGSSRYFN